MGRTLILVESLAAALFLVAMVTAWVSRRPWGIGRWVIPATAVFAVALPAGFTAYGLGFLTRLGTVSFVSFTAWVAWSVAFLVGAVLLVPIGLRRANAGRPWPSRPLAIAFTVAAVLTAITVSNMDVAVKAQLAAVRVEAGARAMALAPPLATDGRNAAPTYRRAFAALVPSERLPEWLGDRATMWGTYDPTAFDPNDKSQRDFLDSQQRGFTLLREAAALPHAAFDRDLSGEVSPVDVLVPELPNLRHATTLLAYDALARASRGDGPGAVDDMVAIFGIARHIRYPLMIDLVTAAAIERTGAKVLEDVLAITPVPAVDLARLTAPDSEPYREYLRRTFAMEEAWGMAAIVLIATGKVSDSPDLEQFGMDAFGEAVLSSPVYRVFFLEEDLATYRRHMRTMRENMARPAPKMLDGFDAHELRIKATRGGGILAGLLIPAAYKVAYVALDADATRGLVRVAVASAIYKAKHGKHPTKLTDLVPDLLPEAPLDPYDGRPLRLRMLESGAVVYSTGRDRHDDGGRASTDRPDDGDLVFRLR